MPSSQFFRNILFPTDFSKSSEAAISHVVGLATLSNAKVWLLGVVPSLADWHGPSENYFGQLTGTALVRLEADRKTLEMGRLEKLKCLRTQHFDALETEICVKSGGVAESIVDYAAEIKADLIMIPTRGIGLMRRFLIGSVTAKVLHDASCAVWTSPHPRELDLFQPYRHILVAIDCQRLSVELLRRASEFAKQFDARLSVVSSLPVHAAIGHELVQKYKIEMAEALQDQISAAGVSAPVHLLEGDPGQIVRQVAEIEEADLVITGHGHLEESMGHLRTHVYEIIFSAPCPVITLAFG
jgi:nucleotide-binding universal stress UspA family protein